MQKENMMDEKLETIAKLTQSYLNKQPVIVLGCGASAPLGIPAMGPLGDHILKALEAGFGSQTYWTPFVDAMKATGILEQVMHDNSYPDDFNDAVIRATWELITEADLHLYCECVSNRLELPLTAILSKLLQSHPRRVKVVTTNYDRIVEYAANSAGARFSTGFTGEYIGRFEPDEEHYNGHTKCVEICKVHGSLDWFVDEKNRPFSLAPASKIPEKTLPLIVTPGQLKYRATHNNPYRTVMAKADKFLSDAPCYLAIGYGFNDEHIQPELIRQIQENRKPIVIVTMALTPKCAEILATGDIKKYVAFTKGPRPEDTQIQTAEGVAVVRDIALWKTDEFTSFWIG